MKRKKKKAGDNGRLPVTQLWNGSGILAGDEICSLFQHWESHFLWLSIMPVLKLNIIL